MGGVEGVFMVGTELAGEDAGEDAGEGDEQPQMPQRKRTRAATDFMVATAIASVAPHFHHETHRQRTRVRPPKGWIGARLDRKPDGKAIQELVEESYAMTAPPPKRHKI